jgi:putative transposase
MPRQKRLNIPGSIYHVISRGIERRKVFLNDKDRENFLLRFAVSLEKSEFQCYAWALTPNHFHLLLRSGKAPLSDLMRSLMTGYAGDFNRAHKRRGVLFQNRFKSILCQEDT